MKLKLPKTIRIIKKHELPKSYDYDQVLKKVNNLKIQPGYFIKNGANSDTFYAEININHQHLWNLFVKLSSLLPHKSKGVIIQHGQDAIFSNKTEIDTLLKIFEKFKLELLNDGNLEFGIVIKDGIEKKVFVTDYKYIKFWGLKEENEKFKKIMKEFQLDEIADLGFIDEAPNTILSIKSVYPNAKHDYEVVEEIKKEFTKITK
jgi:hypothetical protein